MSFDTLPDGGVQMYGEKAKATRHPCCLSPALPYKFAGIFAKYQKINGENRTADLFFVFLQHIQKLGAHDN